jgi:hypothetical protein
VRPGAVSLFLGIDHDDHRLLHDDDVWPEHEHHEHGDELDHDVDGALLHARRPVGNSR